MGVLPGAAVGPQWVAESVLDAVGAGRLVDGAVGRSEAGVDEGGDGVGHKVGDDDEGGGNQRDPP